ADGTSVRGVPGRGLVGAGHPPEHRDDDVRLARGCGTPPDVTRLVYGVPMPTALVVGAGIGGLASGLALRRAGWDVRVFERAADARAIGFGLALAPNAMAALRQLGVKDAIAAVAITPTSAEIRHPDGRVIRRFAGDARELPPGDLLSMILRPALHAVIA